MQNHFDLFQLPQRFTIDRSQLDAAFREVQSKVHPDKFVQASDTEQRLAMQWATQANEAYQTLKDPIKRASYLCRLHGVDLQTESNTSMPPAFLMQQMEWRERFDEARRGQDQAELRQLEEELTHAFRQNLNEVASTLDQQQYQSAAALLRCSLFLEKFLNDIAALDE